jgi:phosphate-selective porin
MKIHHVFGLLLALMISVKSFSKTNQSIVSDDSLQISSKEELESSKMMNKVEIGGYIQPQFQIVESKGAPTISGGNFEANTNNRVMLRRGRLSAAFNTKNVEYNIQIDATEEGVELDEVFMIISLPFLKQVSVTTGIFDRPFGFEIGYSSSKVESAERSRIFKKIIPDEKDLGVMMTLQPGGLTFLNNFTLDAGVFNGTGPNNRDFDNRKDLIGHLYYHKSTFSDHLKLQLGVSFLDGGFDNQFTNHYVWNNGFNLASNNLLDKAVRKFKGIDTEIATKWALGTTQLRGEYVFGQQSGTLSSDITPSIAPTEAAVTRDFTGGYFLFLHNFAKNKLQLVAKYDWMDPNVKISGNNIGNLSNTGVADLKYSTVGLGMNYYVNTNIKLLAYYEFIANESSANVSGYTADIKDNLFTLRLQYKF